MISNVDNFLSLFADLRKNNTDCKVKDARTKKVPDNFWNGHIHKSSPSAATGFGVALARGTMARAVSVTI